jgi:hypothetical protein
MLWISCYFKHVVHSNFQFISGTNNLALMNSSITIYPVLSKMIFTAIMVLLQHSVTGQEAWKPFSPPDEKFSILVPCGMEYGEKSLLTDVGRLTAKTWMCQPADDHPNKLYILSYVNYPDGTFHPDSIEIAASLFEITINQNVKDLGGTLLYETDISKDSHRGKLYRVSYNNNKAVMKSVIFLSGDRFYALQVYALTPRSLNPEMDVFLDSLKF